MSKIFYDSVIVLAGLEKKINKITSSQEEKEELWAIVDEIVHHRVMGCILDKLPKKHHQEFLSKFHLAPHDESLFDYLSEKVGENFREVIRQELGNLAFEILEELGEKSK